jgi:tRNA A-37 threonylcarbamoyl transferase component Bud32
MRPYVSAGSQLGQYRIVEQIGQGGMATVYKALQPALNRYVAIKVLPAFRAEDPEYLERFRREAQTVSRLRHPSILAIFDYGEQDGITYMVSELLPGGTLEQYVGSLLPIARAVRLLAPVAAALDYAHGQGVVHRDVKPSNILLAEDGRTVLGDFGVARILNGSPQLTSTGMLLGTPTYMAPEQAAGRPATPASDCYALGAVLYQLLTGRPPFVADSPMAVALAHLHQPPPMARSVNSDLSEAAERVLLTALAKDPAARFESARAMIRAVERAEAAAGPGVDAAKETLTLLPVGSRAGAESRALSSHRRPALLLVGTLAVLFIIGIVALALTRGLPRPDVAVGGAAPVGGPNALLNPSFEQGGARPTAWRPGTPIGGEPEARMEWSADVSRGGGRSVAIGQPRTGAVWWFDWPGAEGKERAVRVPTGATAAQVAVWCKADDPAVLAGVPPGPSDEDSNQPYLHLRKIAKDGIDYDVQWFALGCTLDWTENSFSTPIPGDAEYLLVWLGLNGPSSATVWFDDVALILR